MNHWRVRARHHPNVRALFRRFPRLAHALPHVDLGVTETPVEPLTLRGHTLLIKRDDLSAARLGGNKVRALEFLLADVERGETVLTVGSTGSTHALATATHAAALGAHTEVITWPQVENPVALRTAQRLGEVAEVTHARSTVDAYVRAGVRHIRKRVRWIPAGGSSAHGALGHVNAALELVEQLELSGARPSHIVVPLGSGGTVAGLIVGLSIARRSLGVLGVRVVPRIIGNRGHVHRLAWQTHSVIKRLAGESIAPLDMSLLRIDHSAYGGAYGRETADGKAAMSRMSSHDGPALDGTYSAKAFGVALRRAAGLPDGDVLFWLTFDARWLVMPPSRVFLSP
jgi:D-cysteine desulfhydrase